MGHPHPITQVCTDNMTAAGIANDTINQQRSRTINLRCFGIRNQKTLILFIIARKSGQENLADYFRKHLSANNHKRVHPINLQTDKMPRPVLLVLRKPDLQGCVNLADSNM